MIESAKSYRLSKVTAIATGSWQYRIRNFVLRSISYSNNSNVHVCDLGHSLHGIRFICLLLILTYTSKYLFIDELCCTYMYRAQRWDIIDCQFNYWQLIGIVIGIGSWQIIAIIDLFCFL